MKYLLDTNVVSELVKDAPDERVQTWVAQNNDDLALCAIVLAELASGVKALPEGKRKQEIAKAVQFLQEDYADRILPFDESAAWEWARYAKRARDAGFVPPLMDSLIAATAQAWGLKVVTRNASDYPLVDVINPFEA